MFADAKVRAPPISSLARLASHFTRFIGRNGLNIVAIEASKWLRASWFLRFTERTKNGKHSEGKFRCKDVPHYRVLETELMRVECLYRKLRLL